MQKLGDARTILIVGDFLASGLGDGLTAAFETSPGVVVEARGNVSSGLVRDDYYDWPEQLPKMIDELKPAMVVVMIGANDRQQMVTDTAKENSAPTAGSANTAVVSFPSARKSPAARSLCSGSACPPSNPIR